MPAETSDDDTPALPQDDDTDAIQPLPPLPDGGLRGSMPDWLRRPPVIEGQPLTELATAEQSIGAKRPAPASDASVVDVQTFLSADDLPEWIRRLAATSEPHAHAPRPAMTAEPSPPPEPRPLAFPRRLRPERTTLAPDASPPIDHGRTDTTRPPFVSEPDPAVAREPSLVWPLLLFGIVTFLVIVAFLLF